MRNIKDVNPNDITTFMDKQTRENGFAVNDRSVTFHFQNPLAAYLFKTWMCEMGEQDYWQWMEYRERNCSWEYPRYNVTGTRFDYWKGDTVFAECGRLDHDEEDMDRDIHFKEWLKEQVGEEFHEDMVVIVYGAWKDIQAWFGEGIIPVPNCVVGEESALMVWQNDDHYLECEVFRGQWEFFYKDKKTKKCWNEDVSIAYERVPKKVLKAFEFFVTKEAPKTL